MNCIENALMSKRSKQWRQNYRKCSVTSTCINDQNKSDQNPMLQLRRKTFKTTQNYKTDQITMNCIDWMSKRSKQRKTTKVIKLPWLASIICQNDQNKAKPQKSIEIQWLASIWRQNDLKCWVTSQNIQNNAKLQNQSNYNELHRLDVKTIKQLKTTKSINLQWLASIIRQNDQNKAKLQKWSKSNDLHRFYVKTIKMLKRSNYNDLHRLDGNTIKTNLNLNYKKWSKSNDLHRFYVKTIKNVELRRKTFKTTLNYKPIKFHWIASIGW